MNSNSYPFIIIHNFTYKNWFVFICLFCIHWRWFRSFFFINCCCYWFQRNERTELQRHDKPIGNDGICWIFFFSMCHWVFLKNESSKIDKNQFKLNSVNKWCVQLWPWLNAHILSRDCFSMDIFYVWTHIKTLFSVWFDQPSDSLTNERVHSSCELIE